MSGAGGQPADDRTADVACLGAPTQIGRARRAGVGEHGLDCGDDTPGGLRLAEVIEHHGGRPDLTDRVRDALSRDVRSGTVDGLEHRRMAPRRILSAIPELRLREMAGADRCCGSAGIYSIVQGAMSRRLLAHKMDDVEATHASVVATANPGCMTQLEAGVRERGIEARVVHVIELLDEAMRTADEARPLPGQLPSDQR